MVFVYSGDGSRGFHPPKKDPGAVWLAFVGAHNGKAASMGHKGQTVTNINVDVRGGVIQDMLLSNYYATPDGNLYAKDGALIKPFKSNKYLQYCLKDDNGKKLVVGAHTVIAFLLRDDYFDGCVVHHLDGNQHNNAMENLVCLTRAEHTRIHADPRPMIEAIKRNGPHNKGKKMSDEFCRHCSESAPKCAVAAYDKDGKYVAEFKSIVEAARWICLHNPNVKQKNVANSISRVCNGKGHYSYNYVWKHIGA